MSRYLRSRTGTVFFFTLVTFERRPILCTAPIRHALRTAIINLRTTRPFTIDGWVLMPDHLHCIWTLPDDDHDYSTRWAVLKRSVSHFAGDLARLQPRVSAQKRRESTIWQRRFWEHQIRDDLDFERHLDYIHFNPVRHGYVKRAVDWPYSTIHRYVTHGVYPADWGGGDDPAWGDFE